MTSHPGIPMTVEERLQAARDALSQDQPTSDPEPDTPAREIEACDDTASGLDDFDAASVAAKAWDRAGRIVRPADRPGDLIAQALAGGAVGAEAIYQMGRKYKRAGWHYSLDGRTGARMPRR